MSLNLALANGLLLRGNETGGIGGGGSWVAKQTLTLDNETLWWCWRGDTPLIKEMLLFCDYSLLSYRQGQLEGVTQYGKEPINPVSLQSEYI